MRIRMENTALPHLLNGIVVSCAGDVHESAGDCQDPAAGGWRDCRQRQGLRLERCQGAGVLRPLQR